MDAFFTWIGENQWAAWVAVALVLLVIETISNDFVFLMLAGAAVVAALTAVVFPPAAQFAVAAVVAVALLAMVRPVLKKRVARSLTDRPTGYERHIGKSAVVTSTVDERGGVVKIEGEEWSARWSEAPAPLPAAPGQYVEVVAIEGAILRVRPASRLQDSIDPPPA